MLPSRSCLQGGLIGSESVDWENTSTDQEGKKRKNQAATLRSNLGERLYTKCHAIPFFYMVTTRTSRRDAFISSFYFFAPPFIDFFIHATRDLGPPGPHEASPPVLLWCGSA